MTCSLSRLFNSHCSLGINSMLSRGDPTCLERERSAGEAPPWQAAGRTARRQPFTAYQTEVLGQEQGLAPLMAAATAALRDVDFLFHCRHGREVGKPTKLLQAQAALSPHFRVQFTFQSAVIGPTRGNQLREAIMSAGGGFRYTPYITISNLSWESQPEPAAMGLRASPKADACPFARWHCWRRAGAGGPHLAFIMAVPISVGHRLRRSGRLGRS